MAELDQFAVQAVENLRAPQGRTCAPEMFASAFQKADRPYMPIVALDETNLADTDTIIIHKGLLHRLGAPLVARIQRTWTAIFANEVYIVYTREAVSVSDEVRAQIERHLGPVVQFLHRPSTSTRGGRPQRAAVVSAYGVGNVGDDLVSLASKQMLLDIGIEEVRLTGPSATLDDIEWADVVALGGGGLFYDWDLENVSNYLWPLEEAKRQGKHAVTLGVGVQGITTPAGQAAYARALKQTSLVSLRSKQDADELSKACGAMTNIMHGNDMAFYLASALRPEDRHDKSGNLAVFSLSTALRTLEKKGYTLDYLGRQTIEFLKIKGYRVLLALHSEDDRKLYEKLAAVSDCAILDTSRAGVNSTAEVYAKACLIVTSRFHGLVLAALTGRPVVSVFSETSKNGKLLSSSLPSLKPHCEPIATFSLPSFLAKIENARAADPVEVEACIAGTMRIKAKVAEVLGLTPVR